MKSSCFLSSLLAGVTLSLWISQAGAQSLDAALAQAYMSNPTLNAQRAATRVTDENVPQALGGYRPTIGATANASAETLTTTVPGGSVTDQLFPRGVGLQVNQTLFNGFRTGNSVLSAEANVLSQREALVNTEQQVLLQAVTAYMNVLRDAALLNLEQNNVDVLQEQLKQTKDRFDVGEVTRTDVEQANAGLAGARSQLFQAQAQLNASVATYRQIIGSQPKKTLAPARPLGGLLPKNLDGAVKLGLGTHPAIVSALHAVDAAAFQVKVAEGGLYPTVTASGAISQNWEPSPGTNRQFAASIGATLSIPIYEGGVTYSKTRQAKETLGEARIQADVLREQVRAAIVSAWGSYDASAAVIAAQQAQVQAAEVALAGVREEAKVGQRTTLDVLNQQQVLLNARATLITAQRDRVVAGYTLLSSIGRLTARQLKLKVMAYDPVVHYDQVRNKWIGTGTPDGR
jgi:outer membrane protein